MHRRIWNRSVSISSWIWRKYLLAIPRGHRNCLLACCVRCLLIGLGMGCDPQQERCLLRSERDSMQLPRQLRGNNYWTLLTPMDLNQSPPKICVLKTYTTLSEVFISVEGFLLSRVKRWAVWLFIAQLLNLCPCVCPTVTSRSYFLALVLGERRPTICQVRVWLVPRLCRDRQTVGSGLNKTGVTSLQWWGGRSHTVGLFGSPWLTCSTLKPVKAARLSSELWPANPFSTWHFLRDLPHRR